MFLSLDQVIQAGGFLWIHASDCLIRINPTDLDYMVFDGVASTSSNPPTSDESHIYLTSSTVQKIDFSVLLGSFVSYGYTGDDPVSIPSGAIVGSCDILTNPGGNAYSHSATTDAEYLYINCSTSSYNNGYNSDTDTYVCHLQKIRKSDMVTVGDVPIPMSTDDMVQNSEYLFLGPEISDIGGNGKWGSDWGLFAVKKTTLEIKYLKSLIPGVGSSYQTNACYGVFYFGNKITVQRNYSKDTFVIDLTNIEQWGENFPVGGATDQYFTFQLNGVDLYYPCNELALDTNGWVHTNTWQSNTLILKFTLDTITTAEPDPVIQTTLISSDDADATVQGTILDTGQSEMTSVGFVYGTDPENMNTNVPSTLGTTFQEILLSLTPDVYYIAAWGTNTEGTWYGNIVVFSTYNVLELSHDNDDAVLDYIDKLFGCSIRCVQDAPGVADGGNRNRNRS